MTEVLTALQLRRLTEHKYSVEGTTLLDPYMQKFWRWLVEQTPLWAAPNAITLTGLIVNLVTTSILMYYSPDARQNVPAWALLLCGLGLFIYQALDAIDGKQARRTGTSSPLGELFDHGCDALSIVFVVLGICVALQLGHQPGWMFFECFAAMTLFYLAHWQTYVSGTLKFGYIDVTEAQMCCIIVYWMTALFGTGFWESYVPLFGAVKFLPLFISIAAALVACHMNFSVIFMGGGGGKNGSTVAGTSVLSPVVPIGIIIIAAFTIWKKSSSYLFELHPCLYVMSFGMVITKVTNKLVICHMTKSEMSLLDTSLLGPCMLFLNQYFNFFINEYFVLWMCFFYVTFDLLRYSAVVCTEICDYLNIYCFTIVPPRPPRDSHNSHDSSTNGDSAKGRQSRSSARIASPTRSSARLASKKTE